MKFTISGEKIKYFQNEQQGDQIVPVEKESDSISLLPHLLIEQNLHLQRIATVLERAFSPQNIKQQINHNKKVK